RYVSARIKPGERLSPEVLRAGVGEGVLGGVVGAPARAAGRVEHRIGPDARIGVERPARHADGAVVCLYRRHAPARLAERALAAGRGFKGGEVVVARQPFEALRLYLEIDAVLAARDLAAVLAIALRRQNDAGGIKFEQNRPAKT